MTPDLSSLQQTAWSLSCSHSRSWWVCGALFHIFPTPGPRMTESSPTWPRNRQWRDPAVARQASAWIQPTSLLSDFTGESKSPGQAHCDGAEVITCPPGWTRNIVTMHSLSHDSPLGPLTHLSCFTRMGKKAQRHKGICLRSHSSQ